MSIKIFRMAMPLSLLLTLGAFAGEPSAAGSGGDTLSKDDRSLQKASNEFFFHPLITLGTAANDKTPLVIAVTLEHQLQDANSFIWQQRLNLGSMKPDSLVKISVFGLTSILGFRSYTNKLEHIGFYFQGSGIIDLGWYGAKKTGEPKAHGFIPDFGALGYVGYKWRHFFLDGGVGYQHASGTLKFDDGQEVDVSASGMAYDLNLGMGF